MPVQLERIPYIKENLSKGKRRKLKLAMLRNFLDCKMIEAAREHSKLVKKQDASNLSPRCASDRRWYLRGRLSAYRKVLAELRRLR